MLYATIAAGVDPSSLFTGTEGALRYGALGLAALPLLLVVIVLLLRKPDPSQERLLTRSLYFGAFCFVLALIAQHFALPDAQLQQENADLRTDLKVAKDLPPPDYSKQKEILGNIVKTLDPSVAELKEINQMALGSGCSGGPSGVPIPHQGVIASRSSNVMANLSNAKSDIETVIHTLPPMN